MTQILFCKPSTGFDSTAKGYSSQAWSTGTKGEDGAQDGSDGRTGAYVRAHVTSRCSYLSYVSSMSASSGVKALDVGDDLQDTFRGDVASRVMCITTLHVPETLRVLDAVRKALNVHISGHYLLQLGEIVMTEVAIVAKRSLAHEVVTDDVSSKRLDEAYLK